MMKTLILGYSNVAVRIAERLCHDGVQVVLMVCHEELPLLEQIRDSHFEAVPVPLLDPSCLQIETIAPDAVVIATEDEQFNVHAAMEISAILPEAQVVTRLFNLAIGNEIEKKLSNVRVLSVSEHAAPFFAAMALYENVVDARRVADRLEVRLRDGDDVVSRKADVAELQCADQIGWCERLPWFNFSTDRLSVAVLAGLFLVVLAATAYFSMMLAMGWQDALYFVVTTLTTTGYGDFSLKEAPFTAKLVGMLVMLSGASLFAILFALVTDRIFRARLDFMMGRRKIILSGHVIVCGAGDVGVRVAESLLLAGVKVVVIERDPDHRFNQQIRELGIPLVLADATLEGTLRMAGMKHARAVVCATALDMHNLEIALNARAINHKARTVLRIYDRSFADRIQQNFSFDAALSSSAIAAPVFARAATESKA